MATKKEPQKPAGPAKTYKTLTPIRHNGMDYDNGAPISLTDAEAAPLLAGKAIEDAKDAKSAGAA